MPMTYKLSMGFAACALLALLQPLQAQDTYPGKPVQIITPAAAGNSPDVAARVFADKLSQLWKQQIVIINRPGAGGLIAAQAASQAEKDGYTLYMTQASTYTVLPVMQEGKLPFDLNKDFVPIGLVGEQPIAVAVAPNLAVNSLPELLELIKTTPGGLLFGATNRGGQSHLTGELLRSKTGLNLTFVHAAGVASTINDVSTGRLPIVFEGIAGLAGAIQPNMPDLPTVSETIPGFESKGWLALMAPAGTPDHIVRKVNADLRKVMEMDEVKQKFEVLGTYPRSLSPEETAAFIQSEQQLWLPLVRQLNASGK
jgi:tripartite-type tricarboxylate transporter receptor subunit TctC